MEDRGIFTVQFFKCILIGLAAAIGLILIFSFITSIIIHNSSLLDSALYPAAIIIEVLAVFGGSFIAAKMHGSRGLIIGLICGLLIFVLILFLGDHSQVSIFFKLLYCLFAGMAGGFLGIK